MKFGKLFMSFLPLLKVKHEKAQEARAHRDALVAIAAGNGVTGEALARVADPHSFALAAGREAKRAEFVKGLGLGIGNAPIMAERAAAAATVDQVDTVPADTDAAVITVTDAAGAHLVTVPMLSAVDLVDTDAADTADQVAAAAADSVDQGAAADDAGTSSTVELTATQYVETARVIAGTPADGVDQVDALHGACPAAVDVYGRGLVDGYRFGLVAGTRAKSLASETIRPALTAAGFGGLVSVTAPRGARQINIVPKDDATVADWSAVLHVVRQHIGAAYALAE